MWFTYLTYVRSHTNTQSQHNYKRAAIIGVSTTFYPHVPVKIVFSLLYFKTTTTTTIVCVYVFSTLIYSRAWFTVVHAIYIFERLFYKTYKDQRKNAAAAVDIVYVYTYLYVYVYGRRREEKSIFTTVTFIWMIHVHLMHNKCNVTMMMRCKLQPLFFCFS